MKRELSSVATIIMGTSPSGDTYNKEGDGLPLLNGPTEFGITYPSCTLYTTESTRECKSGDLIFCVRGSTTGKMNWADKVYSLGRGVCAIRGETELDTKFIRYCIEDNLQALLNFAGGGTFPNLTKETIHSFKIPYPDNRHKIADILSAYDDLIENNTRRIRILEQMAQAIYQEWFGKVDANAESLPKGWEVKPLGEIIDFKNGKAITAENEGDFPIYGSNGIIGRTNESRYENAIIIGRVGAYCGSINYCSTQFSASDNTIIASPSPNSGFAENFAYRLLMNMNLRRYAGGAAQPLLTQSVLNKLETLVPPSTLCLEYEKIAANLFRLQTVLERKNANLRQTRDLLLPRLISGEIELQ